MATGKPAPSKVLHGARAILHVNNVPTGIFNNCNFGSNHDVSPVHILGRFSAAELVYTGTEVVNISCSGFRVLDNGPLSNVGGSSMFPRLKELLTYADISISLVDRNDTSKNLMIISAVKPTGFSQSVGARGLMEFTMNFQGLNYEDETTGDGNAEDATATDLPP